MEIDFRKYNLSEVRESARDYIGMLDQVHYNYSSTAIKQLGSKEHPIPEIVAEAVTRLHNAIAAIDRDAVIEVFSRYKDFSENDPRILVVDAKSALEDLLPLIKIAKKGRLFIAKRIDPNLKQLRQYCTDMITWLDKQLATLNERDYMTPTLDEVACFEDLLEIDAIEWLNWNIFIPELSLSGRKRLLIIALATVDIGEEKKARLQEALSQIEAQIEHQQKKANAREELERMMEMANTPTDKQESFFANEPAEPKDLATAFQDLKLGSYVSKRSFVEATLTYWGKTGSGWTYNNIKSK